MNRNTRYLLLPLTALICCLLLLAACKKNTPFSFNYDYFYYPTDSGHYVIYDVDSATYNYNTIYPFSITHYQWKQVIGDTFIDNLGNVCRQIICYRRPDSTYSWALAKLWYLTPATLNMQVVEEDLRFIRLVFPPQLNEGWNGNIYIPTSPNDIYSAFAGWNYYYENTDTTYSFQGLNLTNVVVVSEVNNVNLINETVRTEMYAPNVGLVYQYYAILSQANTNGNFVAWDSIANNANTTATGFSLQMRAVAFNP